MATPPRRTGGWMEAAGLSALPMRLGLVAAQAPTHCAQPLPSRCSDDIRSRAQLLITNPDMLHQSVLPVHQQFGCGAPTLPPAMACCWHATRCLCTHGCPAHSRRRILANLKYVVVDEGHALRGIFGCHAALVLRRLRRLCERIYNSQVGGGEGRGARSYLECAPAVDRAPPPPRHCSPPLPSLLPRWPTRQSTPGSCWGSRTCKVGKNSRECVAARRAVAPPLASSTFLL